MIPVYRRKKEECQDLVMTYIINMKNQPGKDYPNNGFVSRDIGIERFLAIVYNPEKV